MNPQDWTKFDNNNNEWNVDLVPFINGNEVFTLNIIAAEIEELKDQNGVIYFHSKVMKNILPRFKVTIARQQLEWA